MCVVTANRSSFAFNEQDSTKVEVGTNKVYFRRVHQEDALYFLDHFKPITDEP
jgi:hypothetical protein